MDKGAGLRRREVVVVLLGRRGTGGAGVRVGLAEGEVVYTGVEAKSGGAGLVGGGR
jgi:hypothetical protein